MLVPSGRANKTGGYRLGLMNCLRSLRAAKAQLGQIHRGRTETGAYYVAPICSLVNKMAIRGLHRNWCNSTVFSLFRCLLFRNNPCIYAGRSAQLAMIPQTSLLISLFFR